MRELEDSKPGLAEDLEVLRGRRWRGFLQALPMDSRVPMDSPGRFALLKTKLGAEKELSRDRPE